MRAEGFQLAFFWGIVLNIAFSAAEALFGRLAHSLALIANACHNPTDVVSLLLAWWAMKLDKRLPRDLRTRDIIMDIICMRIAESNPAEAVPLAESYSGRCSNLLKNLVHRRADQSESAARAYVIVGCPPERKNVEHYLNGTPEKTLKISPPYRVGPAELGNWNSKGFPKKDLFMIQNFSGGMDEFCLFNRAPSEREIWSLCSQRKPQPESIAKVSN